MTTTTHAPKVSSKQLKDLAGRIGDVRGALAQLTDPVQFAQQRDSLNAQLFSVQGELEKAAK